LSRAHFQSSIGLFLGMSAESIVGRLTSRGGFSVERPQVLAWQEQIEWLQVQLVSFVGRGHIFFEFVLPRLGRRADVVLVIDHLVFVLEFKVGEKAFYRHAIDQVWDYALDLKNFHETSHRVPIVPVLVATDASVDPSPLGQADRDGVFPPIRVGGSGIGSVLQVCLESTQGATLDGEDWGAGRYSPTPTIIEAARALYAGHSVVEISRSDAGASNLSHTSCYVSDVIADAQKHGRKAICLLTGVPGAGKTLVGLDIATQNMDPANALHSVFLSGNGPLVAILQEALAVDKVQSEKQAGRRLNKGEARRQVEAVIQNVHHFRDDCLVDPGPPPEHVAIFDEAQRAWNRDQTVAFMTRKKGRPDFDASEPEFLLSCMDRHPDWAVVLCLVGGGQEINTGEAGISAWIDALRSHYPHWSIHMSSRLKDTEYGSAEALDAITHLPNVRHIDALHLSVSMRSFRAERVSDWVKFLLDLEEHQAQQALSHLLPRYPIVITRKLAAAKSWLRCQSRGSERFGLVVSSQALRLKPHAIDVRAPVEPVHWFLGPKDDVRSSWYLEDAATEFHVQGLELDWACVVWDADFRQTGHQWDHWSFVGDRWQRVRKEERQTYLKNAYRVLLTRARQGMVIVVPEGDSADPTRDPAFYDETYHYLRRVGVPELS
jgi:Uncharacterized conserved protein (DUF2075)